MFDWLKPEYRERRKKIKLDRKHLRSRARNFLKRYLEADDNQKPQFYRAVDEVSQKCQPPALDLSQSDMNDSEIAEATSLTALQIVLDREQRFAKDDQKSNFVTDACATVAVAYHRAAGVYVTDEEMQKLGTAAVHLLTMATSYLSSHEDQQGSGQNPFSFP